jgi:peptidoglycan/LPS O-acetylase OafA/YrhL
MVVFFHNFGFLNYFGFGWLGVDLFFVLSGYLISTTLLNTSGQPNFLKNFFARRILRIFPVYYLALVLSILILPPLINGSDFYINNQIWFWLYLQNWLFIFKIPENGFLLHFWSLAVEEQFYLVWPFVILLVRSPKRLLILVSLFLIFVMISRIFLWLNQIEGLKYFSFYTFTRVDGICIGCMLALVVHLNSQLLKQYTAHIAFLLSILNFLFFFLNRANSFAFPFFPFVGYTTFAILFALLIYELVTGRTRVLNSFFSVGILRFFGRISYGFYIFHWPVYILLASSTKRMLNENFQIDSDILVSLILTLLALIISYVSYYFFEKRFLNLKRYFL